MLTVAQLRKVLDGLDPDAVVVVGIIEGPLYNAAYAEQQVVGNALTAYICCYEQSRTWEGERLQPDDHPPA